MRTQVEQNKKWQTLLWPAKATAEVEKRRDVRGKQIDESISDYVHILKVAARLMGYHATEQSMMKNSNVSHSVILVDVIYCTV